MGFVAFKKKKAEEIARFAIWGRVLNNVLYGKAPPGGSNPYH